MSIRYANLPASPRSREKPMPAAKAPPIEHSSDHERQLKALARAHSTPQKLAERYASSCSPRMAGRERDGRGTRYLAQDSRPLAPPLAGGGNLRGRGRASERRATFRRAGHLHAGQICQIPATSTPDRSARFMTLACEDSERLDVSRLTRLAWIAAVPPTPRARCRVATARPARGPRPWRW